MSALQSLVNVRRPRTWNKIASISVLAALMLLQLLSLPFYTGSSLGSSFSWRFEHARLTISIHPPQNRESFYVAINNEGLKWKPAFGWNTITDWKITIPLWPLIAASTAWVACAFRKQRHNPSTCSHCGYDLTGLASCPECGRVTQSKLQ